MRFGTWLVGKDGKRRPGRAVRDETTGKVLRHEYTDEKPPAKKDTKPPKD